MCNENKIIPSPTRLHKKGVRLIILWDNPKPWDRITVKQNWKRREKENEPIFKQACSSILFDVPEEAMPSEGFLSLHKGIH